MLEENKNHRKKKDLWDKEKEKKNIFKNILVN